MIIIEIQIKKYKIHNYKIIIEQKKINYFLKKYQLKPQKYLITKNTLFKFQFLISKLIKNYLHQRIYIKNRLIYNSKNSIK